MSRYAKISALSFPHYPYDGEYDRERYKKNIMDYLLRQIERVTPEKPDLIVLPEYCTRCDKWTPEERYDFYMNCCEDFEKMMSDLAKKHKVNIAYSAMRIHDRNAEYPFRNSIIYYDRKGEIAGVYDKCFLVPDEHKIHKVGFGDIPDTLIELDFGRVASAICFDLNDDTLLRRYEELRPDLIVFSSYFKGVVLASNWAARCGAYLAASLVLHDAGRILNPFGTPIAVEDNKFHATTTVNFDYTIVHNDDNQDWRTYKYDAAKEKYGQGFNWINSNGGGVSLLQCDMPDKTIFDVVDEFEIVKLEDYFPLTYKLRQEYYERIANK